MHEAGPQEVAVRTKCMMTSAETMSAIREMWQCGRVYEAVAHFAEACRRTRADFDFSWSKTGL
ncbi:hypothetical protein BN77_4290 [Rhizobium mesoamericanum STM3625]|uniref:Uncharacterized protein n=1 Tax=Rhizobium mesoamericanum STM3625 TaxID=1211777 RepID=K0Q057_9HYPH|nr:hypothetical protein BN77_4290 [Rhizobium mesoamericanum STM3625]